MNCCIDLKNTKKLSLKNFSGTITFSKNKESAVFEGDGEVITENHVKEYYLNDGANLYLIARNAKVKCTIGNEYKVTIKGPYREIHNELQDDGSYMFSISQLQEDVEVTITLPSENNPKILHIEGREVILTFNKQCRNLFYKIYVDAKDSFIMRTIAAMNDIEAKAVSIDVGGMLFRDLNAYITAEQSLKLRFKNAKYDEKDNDDSKYLVKGEMLSKEIPIEYYN